MTEQDVHISSLAVKVQVKCITWAFPSTQTHTHICRVFYSKAEHRGFVHTLGGAEGAGVVALGTSSPLANRRLLVLVGCSQTCSIFTRMTKIDSLLFQHQVEPSSLTGRERERGRRRELLTCRDAHLSNKVFLSITRTTVVTADL